VIDTHAHLDGSETPPEELLARAREAGVERVITPSATRRSSPP
jgi:Tat protein secretion system quality control protein TatD with DNase activity